jgi:class I fructose-bisphosphate aldolase
VLNILPEVHTPNPIYFDPENRIKLALEAGCNAIVSIMGGLVLFSRKYAPKIPLVKLNHNELLTFSENHPIDLYRW